MTRTELLNEYLQRGKAAGRDESAARIAELEQQTLELRERVAERAITIAELEQQVATLREALTEIRDAPLNAALMANTARAALAATEARND